MGQGGLKAPQPSGFSKMGKALLTRLEVSHCPLPNQCFKTGPALLLGRFGDRYAHGAPCSPKAPVPMPTPAPPLLHRIAASSRRSVPIGPIRRHCSAGLAWLLDCCLQIGQPESTAALHRCGKRFANGTEHAATGQLLQHVVTRYHERPWAGAPLAPCLVSRGPGEVHLSQV